MHKLTKKFQTTKTHPTDLLQIKQNPETNITVLYDKYLTFRAN